MDDLLAQLLRADVGVVIAGAADAYPAEVYRLLRAVLQTAQALHTVAADDGAAVFNADIPARAEGRALAAAYAAFVDAHLRRLEGGYLRPALALDVVDGVVGRASVTAAGGEYLPGGLLRKPFRGNSHMHEH